MKITYTQKDEYKKYHKIHCFTCKKDVASKGSLLPTHRNHDVNYVDAAGNIDG